MVLTTLVVVIAVLLVLAGLVLAVWGLRSLSDRQEQERIQSVISEGHATQARSLNEPEKREFLETLGQRTVLAWLKSIISFLSRYTPAQTVQETNRRLAIAGNPFNFRAPQYYGIRMLLLIFGMLLGFVIYRINPSTTSLLLGLLVLALCLGAPGLWLGARIRQRQATIRQGLPDALDMLSVITAAGLSFDQAMLRLGQTFRTPVGMEFGRVVSEMEIGISRRQALRNLQARVDITELSSFVSVILQSETLGMSIADVLHSQAEQMRIYRQFRAKEIASQLPAKMMLPLVAFIFPALLAVLLGPFVPVLMGILQK